MVVFPNDVERLRDDWRFLCGWMGAGGDVDGLFGRLAGFYLHSSRHYHNFRHIEECLELCGAYGDTLETGEGAVRMAIFFHDAVYDPARSDNELRSAELAAGELGRLGVEPSALDAVRRLILITRHADLPEAEDEMLIVDVDLAILGAAPERFDEYERDVRKEYAHVSGDAFRAGRAAVLRKFLARPFIFGMERMRKDFEERARENLARSVARLNR